jgi:hypothetical protein
MSHTALAGPRAFIEDRSRSISVTVAIKRASSEGEFVLCGLHRRGLDHDVVMAVIEIDPPPIAGARWLKVARSGRRFAYRSRILRCAETVIEGLAATVPT